MPKSPKPIPHDWQFPTGCLCNACIVERLRNNPQVIIGKE